MIKYRRHCAVSCGMCRRPLGFFFFPLVQVVEAIFIDLDNNEPTEKDWAPTSFSLAALSDAKFIITLRGGVRRVRGEKSRECVIYIGNLFLSCIVYYYMMQLAMFNFIIRKALFFLFCPNDGMSSSYHI